MTIKVGERLPDIKLYLQENGKVITKGTGQIFSGKRTVMFGVPGAFTPTCSELHLPGYLNHLYDFKQKGIEQIACIAVNDAFVMHAWARENSIEDEILMLADGSAEFHEAVGLDMDMSKFGLGVRCVRYAMVINDNVVELLNVEKGGALNVSKAEVILDAI